MKKLVVLLITVFAFSSYGFTQVPKPDKDPNDFGPRAKFIENLNLTPEQETKFNDLKYNHKKMMIDLRSDIQKNRLEIKKMLSDNNVDEDKLMSLTEANNNLHSKTKTSRVKMWLDVYKILNKEQQELWTKHLANIGEGMRGKFGRGREMHKGPGMKRGIRNFDDDSKRPCGGRGRL